MSVSDELPSALELPPPLPSESADAGPRATPAGPATPVDVVGHALLHPTQQSRTYPCAQCGGELEFNIVGQALVCPQCGNTQPIVEAVGEVHERDLRQAVEAVRASVGEPQPLVSGEKEVVCQNCGGRTTFTGSLTSSRCPYCATPIQRDDVHDAPARLPVDGVLPFTVDRKAATASLEKWIGSRWFAPTEFKKYSRAGSFASVYTAYFTYDAETSTSYTGQRGDTYTVTVGSGQNQRTETRVRWTYRSGTVRLDFDDLPVAANDGFERKHVAALEPWPFPQVRPFSAEFLAGHLSRTYDHSVDACFVEARSQIERDIDSAVRRDIGGDQQRVHSKDTRWGAMTYKHLLLPIWLLAVVWSGRTFQVLVNGTTAEVQGQRPYSKIKIAAFTVLMLLLALGAYLVYLQTSGSR